MTDRYIPSGRPLTDYEREILVILMEECAEVIQAASKLVRFGRENRPEGGALNTEILSAEIGDVLCMVELAQKAWLMHGPDIHNGTIRKRERLAHFMQTAPA